MTFFSLTHTHIDLLSRRVRKVMLTPVMMVRMLMIMMVTITLNRRLTWSVLWVPGIAWGKLLVSHQNSSEEGPLSSVSSPMISHDEDRSLEIQGFKPKAHHQQPELSRVILFTLFSPPGPS